MPSRKPVRRSGHETMHEGDTCNTVVVQYVSFLLQNNHGFHIAIYIYLGSSCSLHWEMERLINCRGIIT